MDEKIKAWCKAHNLPEPSHINVKMYSVVIHFKDNTPRWIKVPLETFEQEA